MENWGLWNGETIIAFPDGERGPIHTTFFVGWRYESWLYTQKLASWILPMRRFRFYWYMHSVDFLSFVTPQKQDAYYISSPFIWCQFSCQNTSFNFNAILYQMFPVNGCLSIFSKSSSSTHCALSYYAGYLW